MTQISVQTAIGHHPRGKTKIITSDRCRAILHGATNQVVHLRQVAHFRIGKNNFVGRYARSSPESYLPTLIAKINHRCLGRTLLAPSGGSLPEIIGQSLPVALLHILPDDRHGVAAKITQLAHYALAGHLAGNVASGLCRKFRAEADALADQPQIRQRIQCDIAREPDRCGSELLPPAITIL